MIKYTEFPIKKHIFCFLFFLNFAVNSNSQGTWTQLTDLPVNQGRSRAVSFILGDIMYVATGNKGGVSQNDNWAFDINMNSWQQKNSTNIQPRFFATSFVINGKAYIGCGNLNNGWSGSPLTANDFYEYDNVADIWYLRANVGATGRYGAVGFSIGNKGYIAYGAKNGSNSWYPHIGVSDKTMYEFDPAQGLIGTWVQKNVPSGKPGLILSHAFVIGEKAYIIGGFTPGFELGYSNVEGASSRVNLEYDPASNSWSVRAQIPEWKQRHAAAAFTILDRAILIGGYQSIVSSQPNDCVFVTNCFLNNGIKYNPHNDTWTNISGSPLGYTAAMTASVQCDYGYVNTGTTLISGNTTYNYSNYRFEDAPDNQYITGPDIVCDSFDAQFALNLNAAGTPTWFTSSNIQIVSGQGTKLLNVRSSSSGSGWVKASFNTGCRTILFPQKVIWSGTYSSSDYPIYGPSAACSNETVYYNTNDLVGATSYQWSWPSSWTYLSGQGTRYLSLRTSTSGGVVIVRVNNLCGQAGSPAAKFTQVTCGSLIRVNAFPNPASSELNIAMEFGDTTTTKAFIAEPIEILLFNGMNKKVFYTKTKDRTLQIPIYNFPKGNYHLNVVYKGKVIKKQVLLNTGL